MGCIAVLPYMTKQKYTYKGDSNSIGPFSVIGTDHSFNDKVLTVALGEDGPLTVVSDVSYYERTKNVETQVEKVSRLEAEIVRLTEIVDKKEKHNERLTSRLSDIGDDLNNIANETDPEDVGFFKRKYALKTAHILAKEVRRKARGW